MLSDAEINEAVTQLADIRLAQHKHDTDLSTVLERYSALLEEHKRLRSDFEEERDARERYKQMARGQERNPFVLVLVDADGYVFDDHLISSGAEGGTRAAQLLLDIVQRSLRDKQLEHCRVMVRCYANLAGLSKTLSKAKLCGPEKRSLAPFVASFNRSADLVDFVDAGELKENADFKLRAMFRLYADNSQCKHIYFAACHDVGYVSELTPFAGNRERITLVRNPALHPEFNKLNLRIEDFPHMFRSTQLDTPYSTGPLKINTSGSAPAAANAEPSTAIPGPSDPLCTFFQKGLCKYGKACKFLHIKSSSAAAQTPSTPSKLMEIRDWRQNAGQTNGSGVPFHMPKLAKYDNNFMTDHLDSPVPHADPVQTQIDLMLALPKASTTPEGHVAVNNEQHRLDAYIQPPSKEGMAAFNARTAKKKLCNNYHIRGECNTGDACEYDHSPITPDIFNALLSVARGMPCPKRGACRTTTCINGHICQKAECRFRGGKLFCRMPATTHTQDLRAAAFVQGTIPKAKDDSPEASNPGSELGDLASTTLPAAQRVSSTTKLVQDPVVSESEDESEDGLTTASDGATFKDPRGVELD